MRDPRERRSIAHTIDGEIKLYSPWASRYDTACNRFAAHPHSPPVSWWTSHSSLPTLGARWDIRSHRVVLLEASGIGASALTPLG